MITTRGLTKRFGDLRAVDGIGLDVRAGDIYGFLGANGSGKTTTVRMLLGLVLTTSGSIEVLGGSMPAARARVLPRVGALVEGPGAYPHLSGRVNLELLDRAGRDRLPRSRRSDRVAELLAEVGLDPGDRRPVRTYSLGMRQRLGLAAALFRRPDLLILDEPTNGLDPQGIVEIRDLLLRLHVAGTTIFLSSHLLAEVEQLCTRVGVIDRGRLVLQEPLVGLLSPPGVVAVSGPDLPAAAGRLGRRVVAVEPDRLLVQADDPAALNAELVRAGVAVTGLGPYRRDLEQVVLEAVANPTPVLPGPPESSGPAGSSREYLVSGR